MELNGVLKGDCDENDEKRLLETSWCFICSPATVFQAEIMAMKKAAERLLRAGTREAATRKSRSTQTAKLF